MTFDNAFDRLMTNEGGGKLVNDPHDPGGVTRWGVCKRAYPHLNIEALTEFDARQIARRDYWDKCRCDELPAELQFHIFDAAFNLGVIPAIKLLQRTVFTVPDGVLGPATLAAVARQSRLAERFCAERLKFYTGLETFAHFGRGWVNRVAGNMA